MRLSLLRLFSRGALALVLLGGGAGGAKAAPRGKSQQPPAAAPAGDVDERKAPAQFGWSGRTESVDMDSRADAKRDEAIAKLKRIMPTVGEGPQRAELIFR